MTLSNEPQRDAPVAVAATWAADPESGTLAESRAAIRFDTFLFASAAPVLITRTYLKLTGYPQVGGHSELHVAHVLWGGLLLGIAMSIMMVSVGSSAKFWASLVGGIGFGLFIDEVGKFLTKDVNYFFKPAIAIIYGTLITAYVIGREVLRRTKLTGPKTRALVAIGIADNELGQLTRTRRDTLRRLLDTFSDDESDALLRTLLESTPPRPRRTSEEWAATIIDRTHHVFLGLARRRWVQRLVVVVLIVEVAISLASVGYVIVAVWLTDLDTSRVSASDIADFISSLIQAVLMGAGLVLLARHQWARGLRIVRAGLFIALMFTTVMEFEDQQLRALTDFAFEGLLFVVVGAAAEAARQGDITLGAGRGTKLRRDARDTATPDAVRDNAGADNAARATGS